MSENAGQGADLVFGLVNDYELFDTLPKEIRDKLNNSVYKFSAIQAYNTLKKYGLKNTLVIIDRTDQQLVQEHGTQTPHPKT